MGWLIIKEIHTPENKGINSSLIEETNSFSFFTTDCTTSTQDPAEPPLLKFKIVENPINSVYIPRSIILKGAIFYFLFFISRLFLVSVSPQLGLFNWQVMIRGIFIYLFIFGLKKSCSDTSSYMCRWFSPSLSRNMAESIVISSIAASPMLTPGMTRMFLSSLATYYVYITSLL